MDAGGRGAANRAGVTPVRMTGGRRGRTGSVMIAAPFAG
jgi:hypothetical protein